jgi:hypothetical protein
MVMMMSKTNDTLKFGHAKLEDRALADSELSAVTRGTRRGYVASAPRGQTRGCHTLTDGNRSILRGRADHRGLPQSAEALSGTVPPRK